MYMYVYDTCTCMYTIHAFLCTLTCTVLYANIENIQILKTMFKILILTFFIAQVMTHYAVTTCNCIITIGTLENALIKKVFIIEEVTLLKRCPC